MIVPGNGATGGEKVGGGSVRGTLACLRAAPLLCCPVALHAARLPCCPAALLGESRNVTQYSKRENVKT